MNKNKFSIKRFSTIYALVLLTLFVSCITPSSNEQKSAAVKIPFLKNSAQECYYLDDFMPIPDNIVNGKYGSLFVRYYTYRYASYKDWDDQHIILSFYSQNNTCWSLFEEYYFVR